MTVTTLQVRLKDKQKELSKERALTHLLNSNERSLFVFKLEELFCDFSKNLFDLETFQLLIEWAKSENLLEQIQALYSGASVNGSEARPALHMALRKACPPSLLWDHKLVSEMIDNELTKMQAFVKRLHSKELKGFTGLPIETVVNLGVGGSELGISLCLEAFQKKASGISVHSIASLDGKHLKCLLQTLNPETTLFIVSSKSFTTVDTLTNANTVKAWYEQKSPGAWQQHFAGVSANKEAMNQYGILADRQFYLWDWIGGRYSIGSAIGLSAAIHLGMDAFYEMLEGMRRVDEHFIATPLEANIPVVMGLLAVWYSQFWNAEAHAVLPYDERLHKFPAYLAQLEMESLGKRVKQTGESVNHHTSPIVFGEVGTLAQHSFFQMLHQGTRFISADFIAIAAPEEPNDIHHRLTLANCLAQSRVLALGYSEEEVRAELLSKGYSEPEIKRLLPHKVHPGNRPSNTILLSQLTPKTLGMLIALYEHKVFVESVLWNINPFDQWSVEQGKQMATYIAPHIGKETTEFDRSTNGLLAHIASYSKGI